ncbi:MAG TPA: thioredoxin [Acidimicrobiales bacterium]
MSNGTLELSAATFDEVVLTESVPVLVEFWAEWCPPCKVLGPILHSIADEYADRLRVYQINSDQQTELARRFDVMSVPTMLIFNEGTLVGRLVGSRSRARLLQELSDFLA